MRSRSIRHSILISTAAVIMAIATVPAAGQMVVYDPSNYAQNVLQAARALQQINNQVTSLQNQTQMLLNQARNLTNLPYSSLQAIDQSISRTQQLLNQAQRLAYYINRIDQAFQRSYPQSYPVSTSSQQLVGVAWVGGACSGSPGSLCKAAGGSCVVGGDPCSKEAASVDQDCNPSDNPGGFFCCLDGADGGP